MASFAVAAAIVNVTAVDTSTVAANKLVVTPSIFKANAKTEL